MAGGAGPGGDELTEIDLTPQNKLACPDTQLYILGMKTTRTATTKNIAQAAASRLGLKVEVLGGDAKRSVIRNPQASRTGMVAVFCKIDGSDMTATDVAAAKELCK